MTQTSVVPVDVDRSPLPADSYQYFSLVKKLAEDPSVGFFPPFLPVEIALKTDSIKNICKSYNISRDKWDELRSHPIFIQAVKKAIELSKEEGWTFKMKALMQSESLLATSWQMIHSADTPPSVKKDLILGTWRAAGVAETEQQKPANAPNFNITLNLG